MNVQRSWATPIAAGAFLLSAVTGVLIFFHVDSGLNKAAHEWLSWLLLGGVVLHVLANLGGFKRHFASRGGLAVMGAFALALALSFIAPAAEGLQPRHAPAHAHPRPGPRRRHTQGTVRRAADGAGTTIGIADLPAGL